jgi:hypothetical protein
MMEPCESLTRSGDFVDEPMSEEVGQIAERCVLDRNHVAGGGPCDLLAWKHHRVDGGVTASPRPPWRPIGN